MFDLKIAGGDVFDGLGSGPVRADVGIAGDRIEKVGDLSGAPARREIDALGRWVCPGFVDVHSHSDAFLLLEPSAPSKIAQGITTEVVGNCGASVAPRFGARRLPSDWEEHRYPGAWSSVADYRRLLESVRPAPNVVLLAGHNAIRGCVMGYEARAARPDERAAMVRALEQAMDEGACGLSTGLIYSPGRFADAGEVLDLARVAARRGGIYATHLRSEGRRLVEALDEAIGIAREAGLRLQVSHLKTAGRENWGLLDAAIGRIERARAEGVDAAADRYPYTASSTDLDVILPAWAAAGTRAEILERLRDPGARSRLRDELRAERGPDYWTAVRVGSTQAPENRRHQGRPLVDVAAEWGLDPADAALRLIETDELRTGGIFFGMSEENLWRILALPWVMIGSDGSLRSPTGPLSLDHPHPRNYGTFPRFLRAAIDGRTVPPAEAIRKMTSLPARQFRLRDRGELREGAFADIAVIDPAEVRDRSTYERPHQLAAGLSWLVINGETTIEAGRIASRRAGRFLNG
jgi:N-acyl-D-amino-acid deacylase